MRIRITFSKTEEMRYTGHLDLFRSWERTFRRSKLPLTYSQGFHPQPRLNLGCALPLGFTSECEIIDAWLDDDISLKKIKSEVESVLPPGLKVHRVELVDDQSPAVQTQISAAIYLISLLDDIPEFDARLQRIIDSKTLPRERRNKSYDLRPLIEAIEQVPFPLGGSRKLRITLSAREAATGRPEEFLDELGIKFEDTRIHREELIFKD